MLCRGLFIMGVPLLYPAIIWACVACYELICKGFIL
nr:MAG TPA: hypothetical protein [Caudoviricetes sp.]